MPVTKTMRECYEIRDGQRGGEWANITLHCWDNPPPEGSTRGMYYGGEITIQSSFGVWGYIWTACANPFKQFLMGAEFDYVFTKFMGDKLHRFDGKASAREVRKWITDERKCRSLSRAEAREAWDEFEYVRSQAECGERGFGDAMMAVARSLDDSNPMHDHFADPCGWPRRDRYDYQALGFWEKLWPLFMDALKAEMQPALLAA